LFLRFVIRQNRRREVLGLRLPQISIRCINNSSGCARPFGQFSGRTIVHTPLTPLSIVGSRHR
jgi:hypothetical protein